jgi:hypothetical protein
MDIAARRCQLNEKRRIWRAEGNRRWRDLDSHELLRGCATGDKQRGEANQEQFKPISIHSISWRDDGAFFVSA